MVRVVSVDYEGRVQFAILPRSIAKNRHLLDGAPVMSRDHVTRLSPRLDPTEASGLAPMQSDHP
jgi:hypothetical protein